MYRSNARAHEFGIIVGPHPLGPACLPSWKNTTPPAVNRAPSPTTSLTSNIYLIRPESARAQLQEGV